MYDLWPLVVGSIQPHAVSARVSDCFATGTVRSQDVLVMSKGVLTTSKGVLMMSECISTICKGDLSLS